MDIERCPQCDKPLEPCGSCPQCGEYPSRKAEIAIPSSGDSEKDAAEIRRFQLQSERMEQNICPNGCGPMTLIDAHNRTCQKCGFVGFQSKPIMDSMKTKGVQ